MSLVFVLRYASSGCHISSISPPRADCGKGSCRKLSGPPLSLVLSCQRKRLLRLPPPFLSGGERTQKKMTDTNAAHPRTSLPTGAAESPPLPPRGRRRFLRETAEEEVPVRLLPETLVIVGDCVAPYLHRALVWLTDSTYMTCTTTYYGVPTYSRYMHCFCRLSVSRCFSMTTCSSTPYMYADTYMTCSPKLASDFTFSLMI